MSVVWILHSYPPVVLGGAEFYVHRINRWLLTHGWTVQVYIVPGGHGQGEYPASFEGVPIQRIQSCIHLNFPPNTLLCSQLWAAKLARPLVHMKEVRYMEFVHYVDTMVLSRYPWTMRRDFTMVYNSEDTRARSLATAPWLSEVPHTIFHPPVWTVPNIAPRTDPLLYPWILLVNFSLDKGGDILNTLSEQDTRTYAAIQGSHGIQCTPSNHVQCLESTLDMDSVWAKTRILIVPSKYETWSMVATEAMARGIPVVAADHIPALYENCGESAIYVNREAIQEWLRAFDTIEASYPSYSQKAILQVHDPKIANLFF